MEYGLNKININLFTQEVKWFGDKGIELHTWDLRNKLHMWHSLWSTLEYWWNILYLLKLPRLGGDTCLQLIRWKIMKLKIIEIKIYLYLLYYK